MSAQVTEIQVYFSSLHMSRHVAAAMHLGSFTADPPSQLDVLGHDSNPLGMDGAEVGVLKESNQVSLTSFLKGHHSRALEPQISLEVLGNLTNKPLEWKLANEQLCGLLVPEHVKLTLYKTLASLTEKDFN